ncbi:borealin-related [Carabus blaptoides fortunei]
MRRLYLKQCTMPRTKYIRNTKNKKSETHSSVAKANGIPSSLKIFERELDNRLLAMDTMYRFSLDQVDEIAHNEYMVFTKEMGNKTIGELRKERSISSISTFFDTAPMLNILNSTKNMTQTGRKKKVTEDEGYLTAESTRGGSSGDRARRNRSNQRSAKDKSTVRSSRSLSRSNVPKNVTIQLPKNARDTPQERRMPPATYGFVTPKVKPNTPLAYLRHPKQGEMAISMQGSPLLVSSVTSETCANVNIPLGDGRILSLQPNRGLRMSQFPNLDDETRTQLRTLRDNLNKVVQLESDY